MSSKSASQIIYLEHNSSILRNNPLGDPSTRRLPVYLPPGYDDEPKRRYPVIWMLTGYTGWGERLLNLSAWDENIQQRLDRLILIEKMPPVIMALPNCFTRYGGSQYINSSATGRYQDYLISELIPELDNSVHTLPDSAHRAVMGKSSGGYGAMVLGMRHPDQFSALACHSGDMMFEYCYRNDFPKFVNGVAKYGGSEEFLATFETIPHHERSQSWFDAISILAMSACYSPNLESRLGFDLPCDEYTGQIIDEVWTRWLAHDPLNLLADHLNALRPMRLLYLDCGNRDEFNLHLGARQMIRQLDSHNIDYQYEEFDGGHSNLNHRYDVSLPALAAAISPQ